jgi:DNA repair protein RecO (recombination protein O)
MLITTEAIVLHSFPYLESSRIVRMVTREAGLRSALARGVRKSMGRFGGGLNLFAEGTAHLHTRSGRDLDTLASFDAARVPTAIGEDMGRFLGASALAELTLRFSTEASADQALYEAVREALSVIEGTRTDEVGAATVAGGWRIVQALGYAPSFASCVECDHPLEADEGALFSLAAGGVLCTDCAGSRAGRVLPQSARAAVAGWLEGIPIDAGLSPGEIKAHHRLFYEFVSEQLLEGRPAPAIDLWYRGA